MKKQILAAFFLLFAALLIGGAIGLLFAYIEMLMPRPVTIQVIAPQGMQLVKSELYGEFQDLGGKVIVPWGLLETSRNANLVVWDGTASAGYIRFAVVWTDADGRVSWACEDGRVRADVEVWGAENKIRVLQNDFGGCDLRAKIK